jgi:NADH:ubiquinone oxidoreductase subunit 6 (subunit J)
VTVSIAFVVLSTAALVGAGGLLFCRRAAHCVLSFLLTASALAGLYALLNLQFIAVIQLAVNVALTALTLIATLPLVPDRAHPGRSLWPLGASALLLVVAYWGIVRGTIQEPLLALPPVWASRGDYIATLGHELTTSYSIFFALSGLLFATCIVGSAYALSQGRRSRSTRSER